jgi:hypothetical protein
LYKILHFSILSTLAIIFENEIVISRNEVEIMKKDNPCSKEREQLLFRIFEHRVELPQAAASTMAESLLNKLKRFF